jgi:hypothetical protein
VVSPLNNARTGVGRKDAHLLCDLSSRGLARGREFTHKVPVRTIVRLSSPALFLAQLPSWVTPYRGCLNVTAFS